jgi:hypothetical protein
MKYPAACVLILWIASVQLSGQQEIYPIGDTIAVTTTGSLTYYFDATGGSDSYPVNSRETPWQTLGRLNEVTFGPGDSVLLKSGQTWEGQVVLKGSGTEGHPITLSNYGAGPRPKIDGNGTTGGVITLNGLSYWNLSNLEITNPASGQASRLGVLITAAGGNHGHVCLDSLYIHDISGRYSFEMIGKNTGGIGIIGENDTRFDDILIENCEITDIVRVGIFTSGNTGVRGDRPITNLVIRNNTVSRCAGDGMIIRYAYRPLIEHNLAIENHNAPEELVDYGVAIWVRSTDEAVIQYNRVFDTRGSMDGQAFDTDLDAYRTLVQYNYTHGNEGGFMLVYGSSRDAIVRYNISQDDGLKGKHILDFPTWVDPRGSGIIHNNIFYTGEEIDAVLVDEALPTARFYNNIVINHGSGELTVPSGNQTATFSNNALVGYPPGETTINSNPVEGDPGLADPGTGDTAFSSLDGYMLAPESPCLRSGLPLSQMEGSYWVKGDFTDFWGNPVDPAGMDVGAHQLSGPLHSGSSSLPFFSGISWSLIPEVHGEGFFLSLNLPGKNRAQISLFDIGGRHLGTLFSGELPGGTSTLHFSPAELSPGDMHPCLVRLSIPETGYSDGRIIINKQ